MKNKGFTLIELLVVISIISLLSSIVLAALGDARYRARVAKFRQEVQQFTTAIELIKNGDVNNLPDVSLGVDPDGAYISGIGLGGATEWANFQSEMSTMPTPPPITGMDFRYYGTGNYNCGVSGTTQHMLYLVSPNETIRDEFMDYFPEWIQYNNPPSGNNICLDLE